MPSRLRPTNPTAPDAVLVGDPGRALMLAQELLVDPLMSNHARGLWGYTAATHEGLPLTVQATGMGGPSAAIVFSDLARLGLRRAIRVGSCEALDASLTSGDLVVVEAATLDDGTSRRLSEKADRPETVAPSAALAALLAEAGLPRVTVRSGDLGPAVRWATGLAPPTPIAGRRSVADLQTATLFALAARLGIAAAAILVAEGPATGGHMPAEERARPEELEDSCRRAGAIAAACLSKAQVEA